LLNTLQHGLIFLFTFSNEFTCLNLSLPLQQTLCSVFLDLRFSFI
jgi:hypothetical protein